MIGFVRFVIVKDTQDIQKAQLDLYSQNLSLQKSFILTAYKQTATIITEHLYRNPKIYEITKEIKGASPEKITDIQNQLNKITLPLFEKMKEMGVSYINFDLNHPIHLSGNKLTQEGSNKPFVNFTLFHEIIGYKYDFPFVVNGDNIGMIEIGFDFHLIKKQLLSVNNNANVGFIVISRSDSIQFDELSNNELNSIEALPNFWVDHEFKLPMALIGNTKSCEKFKSLTFNSINNEGEDNFSMLLKSNHEAVALSMSKVENTNDEFSMFLISATNNPVLSKVRDLNNAIFIINLIIIVLGMFGMAYLIINRYNILHQKKLIQKSEEKLIALNRSKDKFFSIIAHDLKNPFNGIMGMSGYLSAEFDDIDNEEKREIINDINISSKNAFNLLQNLLEWTRTQSGLIKNIPVAIVPMQITELALETVTNLAKNKEIEIKQTFLTEARGFADENLVSTVIRNLCTNAIKFSPRESTIEITVKQYENELVFCVTDQGIGLGSEEIDQLFRIDVNFHKRGTEKETGSGLGLKLCKEFIDYCKGRIWVVSEPGRGSSFYFTIPVYNEELSTQ